MESHEIEKIDIMGLLMSGDPQAIIRQMMKLPIKNFFKKGISYKNLTQTVFVFSLVLLLQLKYSKRSRSMALRMCHTLMFGVTFFGLLITVAILFVKYKLHKKSNAND